MKVDACRALSQLLPGANREILRPHLMSLFSSLTDLLNQVMYCYRNLFRVIIEVSVNGHLTPACQAYDETLHLVLETLQAAIQTG